MDDMIPPFRCDVSALQTNLKSWWNVNVSLQVADLLVAMCKAALHSPRKSIIFEPYPSIVDPLDPQTLAFSPKVSASLVNSCQVCSSGFAFLVTLTYCVTGTKLQQTPTGSEQHPVNQKHRTGTFLYYLFANKWLFGQCESLSNCCG